MTKVTLASTALELVFQGLQVNLVCQVSQVLQDLLVFLDRKVKKDKLEQLVPKDYLAFQELQVLQAFLDLKVNLVISSLFQE